MEEIRTTAVSGNVTDTAASQPSQQDGYVSPDVAAAEAGETVDFSKHVETDDESTEN